MSGTKEFVRTSDMGNKVLRTLAHAIEDAGGTDRHLRLLQSRNFADEVAELLVASTVEKLPNFIIDDIARSGTQADLLKSFKTTKEFDKYKSRWKERINHGGFQARVVKLRGEFDPEDIRDEISHHYLRPATLLELLWIALDDAKSVPVQHKLVALGTSLLVGGGDEECVPFLTRNHDDSLTVDVGVVLDLAQETDITQYLAVVEQ